MPPQIAILTEPREIVLGVEAILDAKRQKRVSVTSYSTELGEQVRNHSVVEPDKITFVALTTTLRQDPRAASGDPPASWRFLADLCDKRLKLTLVTDWEVMTNMVMTSLEGGYRGTGVDGEFTMEFEKVRDWSELEEIEQVYLQYEGVSSGNITILGSGDNLYLLTEGERRAIGLETEEVENVVEKELGGYDQTAIHQFHLDEIAFRQRLVEINESVYAAYNIENAGQIIRTPDGVIPQAPVFPLVDLYLARAAHSKSQKEYERLTRNYQLANYYTNGDQGTGGMIDPGPNGVAIGVEDLR